MNANDYWEALESAPEVLDEKDPGDYKGGGPCGAMVFLIPFIVIGLLLRKLVRR